MLLPSLEEEEIRPCSRPMAVSSQQRAAPSAYRVELASSLGLCSLKSEWTLSKTHSLSGLRGPGHLSLTLAPDSSTDRPWALDQITSPL